MCKKNFNNNDKVIKIIQSDYLQHSFFSYNFDKKKHMETVCKNVR